MAGVEGVSRRRKSTVGDCSDWCGLLKRGFLGRKEEFRMLGGCVPGTLVRISDFRRGGPPFGLGRLTGILTF